MIFDYSLHNLCLYAIDDLVSLSKQGWIPIIRLPFIFYPDKGSAWLGVVFWEAMVFTGGILSSVDMGYGDLWGGLLARTASIFMQLHLGTVGNI